MPRERGLGKFGNPEYGQAAHIIKKMGGEARLAKMIGVSRITCYRWQMARPYGTGGLVPLRYRAKIEALARVDGVLLLPGDWETSLIRYDYDRDVLHASTGKSLQELLS